MSLIHWWPLNGNTTDLGISPCIVTGTPTFNAAGKIGQCLSGGALTMPAAATAQVFNKDAVSVCFWLYNGGSAGCIFGTDPMTPPNNRRFTLFQYPTTNDLHWSWQNEDSGGTFTSGVANGAIPSNAWSHICAVWDNGTARIYVNGTQVGTSTGTCTSTDWAYDTVIARPSSTRYYNDIRIYNHALSAKEVKEISKGLMLYYNFEDIGRPNLLLGNWSCQSTNSTHTTSGTVNITLPTGMTLNDLIGKTLAFSYDYSVEGDRLNNTGNYSKDRYGIHGSMSVKTTSSASVSTQYPFAGYLEARGTGKAVQYFSIPSSWYSIESLSLDLQPYNRPAAGNNATWYIKNLKLEILLSSTDKATDFIDSDLSKIYDNSGYGYNGTISGNIQLSSDSAAGKHSIYSPAGDNYVERQNFPAAGFNADQQFTINAWIKIVGYIESTSWNTIFRLAATNARDQQLHFCYNSSGNIILSQYSDDPQFTLNVPLNTWAMVTWVHYLDGSTAKCQYFVNGQQVGSTQSYSGLLNIKDNARLTLFYDSIRRDYASNLYMGDFKIYSTALSAEDILAEYNRKAAIDKNGNLFTGEIIETADSATKIDKNSFIDSNLFATTMTLEDGSLWAPICVHYVPDGLFKGSSNTFYYTGRNIWENFGAINDLERPESNQWEFYVMQQSTVGGPFSKYRFKQNVSPLSATWDQVNPSKVGTNVTRISSSKPNNYAGMYWYNTGNVAMCFANTSNGNWFGCGARAYWGDNYTPGYNGEQVRGWQLVYMRISKHKARMFKNGIMIPTDIIEN